MVKIRSLVAAISRLLFSTLASAEAANPMPQGAVMRALLRAAHEWVSRGVEPPASRYPRLDAGTLATTTGGNFRSPRGGNPQTILALLGSCLPFAPTSASRSARRDPRPSIEETQPQ